MSPHRYARCSYSVQYSVQVGCIIDLTQNCHRNSQGYPIQHTYPCMRYRDLMDESWSYLSAVSSSLSIPSDTGFILPWRSLILLYSVLKAPQQTTPNSAMRFLFRARPCRSIWVPTGTFRAVHWMASLVTTVLAKEANTTRMWRARIYWSCFGT